MPARCARAARLNARGSLRSIDLLIHMEILLKMPIRCQPTNAPVFSQGFADFTRATMPGLADRLNCARTRYFSAEQIRHHVSVSE